MELGVAAAELVAAALVARRHLDLAHRQRRAGARGSAPNPLALRLGRAQQVEVDLDRRTRAACSRRTCGPRPRTRRRTGTSARCTLPGRRPCRSAPRTVGIRPRPEAGEGARRGPVQPRPWSDCGHPDPRPARLDKCRDFQARRARANRPATVHAASRIAGSWSDASSSPRSPSRRSSSLMHYALDLDETVEFVLSAAALIPLAWLIGEATEHAAEHTGPGIGGFLNATFGNAPELIIALLAVNEGLNEVVRGSLTGSRDRQPPARPRLLALLRRPRRDRPPVELHRARARGCDDADPADPVGPGLGRRPRQRLPRRALDPDRDRAAARLRRADRGTRCAGTRRCTSRATTRSRRWSLRLALVVLAGRDRRDRARGRDPRRHRSRSSPTRSACRSSSSPR